MKSRVIKLCDYRDVPLDKEVVIEGVKDAVDGLVRSIVKHYKTKVAADKIENGDIVTLKCESEMPKFNKPIIPVNVGKGLFDKDFEAAILGMSADEEKEITIENSKVNVKVISINRTVYPKLTDEMIKEYITGKDEDYGDVKTADEYLKAAYEKTYETMKDQEVYNILNYICVEVFDRSEWAFDEDEFKAYEKYEYETEIGYMRQEGIEVDNLKTEDDYLRVFGDIHNREELDNLVNNIARDTIAMYLMTCTWMNIDPETIDIFKEPELPEVTDLLCNYIKETVTFKKED